jgi:hypothetical protein
MLCPNPLIQPPIVLIEDIFRPIAAKRVGRQLSESLKPVGIDQEKLETDFVKKSLQKLAFKIQESVDFSNMHFYFCSACGVLGFQDDTRSLEMVKVEGYTTHEYEVQKYLRAKAGCEKCSQSLDRMYYLIDRLVCTCRSHCGNGLKPAIQVQKTLGI